MSDGEWRKLGWFFAQGWSPFDCDALFFSGIVPTKTERLTRSVYVATDADLTQLRKAGLFMFKTRRPKLPMEPLEPE